MDYGLVPPVDYVIGYFVHRLLSTNEWLEWLALPTGNGNSFHLLIPVLLTPGLDFWSVPRLRSQVMSDFQFDTSSDNTNCFCTQLRQ